VRLTIVAENLSSRFAIGMDGNWYSSWCYGRWLPAFRSNPVPDWLRTEEGT